LAALIPSDREEAILIRDPRLAEAIAHFNAGEWYACHDGFEALWHETAGPVRAVLQGILQIAVGQLHLERGNHRGATILTGEGLGRLLGCGDQAVGLDLAQLRGQASEWLQALQSGADAPALEPPRLTPTQGQEQGHAL
jgi:predicted metal-dependent hydrolase